MRVSAEGPRGTDYLWIAGIGLGVGILYFTIVQRAAIAKALASKPATSQTT
jgi:hypothetical protein